MMHEHKIYSNLPVDDSCCEAHASIPAPDHLIAAATFTLEDFQHDEGTIPPQKFRLALLVDGATIQRGGVELTPGIIVELLDRWGELVNDLVGPRAMAEAMVSAVVKRYGAQIVEDEVEAEVDVDGPTPANPIVGGRRRGDYIH